MKNNKIVFKYFNALILKNKFLWLLYMVMFALIICIPMIVISNSLKDNANSSLILDKGDSLFDKKQILNTNALIIFLPIFISINLFIAIASICLFTKTKKNNVDLYIYIQPISKRWIFWLKQLTIIKVSLLFFVPVAILSFSTLAFGVPFGEVMELMFLCFLNIVLMSFIWTLFYSIIGQTFSFWVGISIISCISIMTSFGLIIPIITQNKNNPNFDFDSRNQKNLLQISILNNKKELVKKVVGVYENPIANNDNNLTPEAPSKIFRDSPLNALMGFMPLVMFNNGKPSIDMHLSTRYLKVDHINHSLYNTSHLLISKIGEKSIFDYQKKELFEELYRQIIAMKFVDKNIKNNSYWDINLRELKNEKIWNIKSDLKNLIIQLSGISSTNTLIYNIFNNNDIAKNRMVGFTEYISEKISPEFAKFLKYIWYSSEVKLNMFSYNSLGDLTKYENLHIELKNWDVLSKATEFDVEKFKNKLFHPTLLSDGSFGIKILNNKEIYDDMDKLGISKIFGRNFNSVEEFTNYIDNNSTINNLQDIYKRSFSYLKGNISPFAFHKNIKNNLVIYDFVKFSSENKFPLIWAIIVIILATVIIMQLGHSRRIIKKDLI